ncbi:GDSL esterase/lipase-like [Dorcoceras hygrometricum]|uniref:GDSL esterase/lipase-like n=1 Tax=Dorcoceras hygrometricum TaxID=472368 RepID=A0A2Z7B9L6_9LAMI|nr:GDSL esterase/lipase-like [Dorcoceras hygrometricum]
MELSTLIVSFFCFCSLITSGALGSAHHHHSRGHPTKLFVFGDSYADTGNVRKALANSWKAPYGITFPGKPAGRFSDGRVLTDYVAKSLGLKTPVAYAWRDAGVKKLRYGMNFAFGGSGVFDTLADLLPNMTTQIDFFENLFNESVYTKWDVQSSVVLVTLSGNDYAAYLEKGGTIQGLQGFIPRVVNQLALNLRRISEFGPRKIVVAALQPLGCLPRMTQLTSFQQCNDTENTAVQFHNLLLRQAVAGLNNETRRNHIFVLDLYDSFTTVLDRKNDTKGKLKFESPLKPCCVGTCAGCSCGSVDAKGTKLYTVCSDPKSSFFWDSSHPTQAGWRAVYTNLKSTLEQFF